MRLTVVILCACVLGGCATRPPAAAALQASHDAEAQYGTARLAAALIFDPPVAAGQPQLQLARAPRQPAAFVSYDQVFTTYFYLRLDDRQILSRDGLSQRRVVSETFGISRR